MSNDMNMIGKIIIIKIHSRLKILNKVVVSKRCVILMC